MIIACEQCQTQFQLDDRRIPSGGARVRCSKCQHAFFVRPPEVEAETTLQGMVGQAVEEAIPAPEPETGMGFGQTDPGLSEAMQSVDELPPDEWTFNDEAPPTADLGADMPAADDRGADLPATDDLGAADDPGVDMAAALDPGLDSGSGLFGEPGDLGSSGTFRQSPYEPADPETAAATAQPATETAEDPAAPPRAPAGFELEGEAPREAAHATGAVEPDPVEDLGAPEDWDFLADANPAPVHAPPVEEPVEAEPEPAPRAPRRRRQPLWFVPDSAPTAGAWLLTLALLGWGGLQVVGAGLAPTPAAPIPIVVVGGGSAPQEVRAERLENLHAGSILVVSGQAPGGASAGQGLRVRLLDAEGTPLEAAAAWAGPATSEEPLREADPAELRRGLQAASASLRAGTPFQAVFESAPADAYGLELHWTEAQRDARGPEGEGADDGGRAGADADEAGRQERAGDTPGPS